MFESSFKAIAKTNGLLFGHSESNNRIQFLRSGIKAYIFLLLCYIRQAGDVLP